MDKINMIPLFHIKNLESIPQLTKEEVISLKPTFKGAGIFVIGRDKDEIFILISNLSFESTVVQVIALYFQSLGMLNDYFYSPIWNSVYAIQCKK